MLGNSNKRLTKQLYNNIRRRVRPTLIEEAYRKFNRAKEIFIDELRSHPVSLDISNKGYLFGLLGFPSDSNPIEDLVKIYDERIVAVEGSFNLNRNLIGINIRIPSKSELAGLGATVEWATNVPWPELVEIGVPNVQYFLQKEGVGRSEEGVQAKGPISGRQTAPLPYLSVIISNFKKNLVR